VNVPNLDLFVWWALSISFSIMFLAVVSIYIYLGSKSRRRGRVEKKAEKINLVKLVGNFAFVWVLLGLLVFYIFSIQLARTSVLGVQAEVVFTVGNIVVEALLVLYLLRNREEKSEKT
jgi:amino acid transporter